MYSKEYRIPDWLMTSAQIAFTEYNMEVAMETAME